jgi:hypothetical protein
MSLLLFMLMRLVMIINIHYFVNNICNSILFYYFFTSLQVTSLQVTSLQVTSLQVTSLQVTSLQVTSLQEKKQIILIN